MAYKQKGFPMHSTSALKQWWNPWSKKRRFKRNTVVVDGKTYDKDEYKEAVKNAEENPDQERIDEMSTWTNEEIEAYRQKLGL